MGTLREQMRESRLTEGSIPWREQDLPIVDETNRPIEGI
jgi:hypothetical protein